MYNPLLIGSALTLPCTASALLEIMEWRIYGRKGAVLNMFDVRVGSWKTWFWEAQSLTHWVIVGIWDKGVDYFL